ncbi:PAS domain S-box protein [Halosimplex amylolyticum]|uniref:sensor histidine kinase n=1 Tax=Halosimplex amylolyticum TaxID=3396616 RepID=UPI003F57CE24
MSGTPTAIRVLHVDDDRDLGGLVAAALEREDDRFDVLTATSPAEALDLLADERIDCVVSDYDMPGTTGIEFLETVRERDPDLPFILYTGKGSEEVASGAISAGVTDYLQKGAGSDHYALLANRIDNAVSAARSRSALEERNRRLETLISNLPGVVYRCRNEAEWPMEFVAGECTKLTGYSAAELERGAVVWGEEVLHPEDRDRLWETVQSALDAGDPFEVTYRILTADGEVRWMWERGRAIGDDADRIEGFITDVTERHERERRLEATSARLEALVENSPDMIDVLDPGGTIVDANQRLCDALGYDEQALRGTPIWEIDERVDPDHVSAYLDGLAVGEARKFDGRYRRSDGSTFPVEVHLVRIDLRGEDRYLAISRDITERKRREDALSALTEATRRFMDAPDRQTVADHAVETAAAVLDEAISGVWFVDDGGGALRPVAATDAARALIGELPTYTGGESLTWEAYRSGEVTVCEDLRTEPDRYNPETPLESEIILPLGEYGVLAVGATEPSCFDEVDVWLARILANTVSAALDRAAREQESREHRRELERQNERLDEFAGIVSHDLRNPLQVATARAEFLAEEVDSEHLTAVQRAHDRMEALIDDLLTLGREGGTVLDVEPVDLGSLARTCWETAGRPDASLVVATDDGVRADRRRLQQLLENLIGNAVEHGSTSPGSHARQDADGTSSVEPSVADAPEDATEHGSTSPRSQAHEDADGTSSVEPSVADEQSSSSPASHAQRDADAPEDAVEHDATNPTVTVRVGTLEDRSGFFVADDGPGIPAEKRQKAFESGYSTAADGAGFGLSIVEQIAHTHGWSIAVTESETGGARFEITDVDVTD